MKKFLTLILLASSLAVFAGETTPAAAESKGWTTTLWNIFPTSAIEKAFANHPRVAYGVTGTTLVGLTAVAAYRYCPAIKAYVNHLVGIQNNQKAYRS